MHACMHIKLCMHELQVHKLKIACFCCLHVWCMQLQLAKSQSMMPLQEVSSSDKEVHRIEIPAFSLYLTTYN